MRWWFAIKNAWSNRQRLKQFLTVPEKQLYTLEEITADRLDKANVAILVLDMDGVLCAHDALQPSLEAEQWLKKISLSIGEQRIALLTNKPKLERLGYFAKYFPSLFVVQGVKKKPYPEGLLEIAEYKGVSPHRLLLVDDRLLTGMLATCLAYTQGWYFAKPKTNFWKHPVKECFFCCLRLLERALVRLLG